MSAVELADAAWFPADLHVPNRAFGFLRIDGNVLERSTFLDNRIDAPLDAAVAVPVDDVAHVAPPTRMGWLLHTSFCCSTLLARMLHTGAEQVSLREPLVLRRLADARRSGWPVDDFVRPAIALLGRPWSAGGMVVVKPTHVALNIAPALLAASNAPALVLTSSLDDFLVSNIKKLPETQARIPELAERALAASGFGRSLPGEALAPPDLMAAAALQWAAQRALCAEITLRAGGRLRWLDAASLLAEPEAAALAAARWLGSTVDDSRLRERARDALARHAKATSRPYGPAARDAEAGMIRDRYGPAIHAARRWFDRVIEPRMPPAALEPPIEWRLDIDSARSSDAAT